MRFLLVALAALPFGAATAEPPSTPAPERPVAASGKPRLASTCPKPLAHWGERQGAVKRNLAELPPADAFHAVYRTDQDGCIDQVMVGYQFGRVR